MKKKLIVTVSMLALLACSAVAINSKVFADTSAKDDCIQACSSDAQSNMTNISVSSVSTYSNGVCTYFNNDARMHEGTSMVIDNVGTWCIKSSDLSQSQAIKGQFYSCKASCKARY